MGFPTSEVRAQFTAPGYRLGLAIYGALGFLLSTWITTKYDPEIYRLVVLAGKSWKPGLPEYAWGFKVLWLSLPLFLFIFEAAKISMKLPRSIIGDSLSYGIFIVLVFVSLAAVSLINFGLNGALTIQFAGYGFILGSTEFLRGFQFDFSFAQDKSILREARMEKIKFLHKKWFSAISALVTVAIAICVTAAIKLFETSIEDLGHEAAELLAQILGCVVVYAGVGLTLGPFAEMFKILAKIEDQMDHIEAPENAALSRTRP